MRYMHREAPYHNHRSPYQSHVSHSIAEDFIPRKKALRTCRWPRALNPAATVAFTAAHRRQPPTLIPALKHLAHFHRHCRQLAVELVATWSKLSKRRIICPRMTARAC